MMGLYQLLATTIVVLCIPMNTGRALADGETKVQCIQSEAEALLNFTYGFDDTANRSSSWARESDCCKWAGVECNATTCHVTSLDLSDFGIQGKLNSALLGLPYLTYLNLSFNDFMGSQLPGFLGSLHHLQYLDFHYANFSGTVPDELGNLSRLISLDLSWNYDLTCDNLQWLHSLSALEVLDLSDLNLSDTADGWIHAVSLLPSLAQLSLITCGLHYLPPSLPQVNFDSLVTLSLGANMFNSVTLVDWLLQSSPNIRYLSIADNNLTGPMPLTLYQTHTGKHLSLRELHLSYNHLYGPLKMSTIAQLPELVAINVEENDLQDVINEADFENFSNLKLLMLSGNHVIFNVTQGWVPPFQLEILGLGHCQLGPQFPNWIQTQNNLSSIDLSSNNISGIVPKWIWDLSLKVVSMDLSSNDLRGHVPDFSSNLKLQTLDLSNNSFASRFPYLPPNIWELNLARNSFFGPISHICKMNISQLRFLDLFSNNLSGNLPNCWTNGTNLLALVLANNNFSGPIPNSFGSLVELQSLSLNKNNFSGTLPLSLKNCSYLMVLDLGNNQLSGTIPSWIGRNLQILVALILSSNLFEGNIPLTLCQLKSLQILDLSLNRLSGTIPRCIFVAMATEEVQLKGSEYILDFERIYAAYMEPLSLIWKRSNLTFGGQNKFLLLKLLHLSSNLITGDIPEEITSYVTLKSLNLSRNQLTGFIPFKIGKMKSLEVLDLSWNNLSSTIPSSLSDMDQLTSLDVSHNNLTGQIPLGNHLDTFDSTSFVGNPNLCGRPLNKSCYTNQSSEDPPKQIEKGGKRDGLKIPSLYISMGIGYITGFWAIWGPLLLSRRWRQSYYHFWGNMYDKLYVMVAITLAKWKRTLRRSSR